ncbi:MAG TPA: histidinol dehydrogenase [Flavobacterium sp.]|nr:histidinol dehydrogenase [Flavobacterium sp.]
MQIIKNPAKENWPKILERPAAAYEDLEQTVKEIFKEVQSKGDAAVSKYASIFDGAALDSFEVSKEEIEAAISHTPDDLKEAIRLAKSNIERFHKAQAAGKIEVETAKGVFCWKEKRPIQKVGLYIPGGSAPLFSTVLMLAVPAKIAGCASITLCSPPDKDGRINPAILYAASLCGVTRILKIGGIQAIAAMAFGTETIEKVYKIFGPGNQFVTAAKQFASRFGTAIDMPAGPSELLVFADDSADASFVAADLLSQAEHGSDSQVLLVSTSQKMIDAVSGEIEKQLAVLPRHEIAKKAIENSKAILVEDEAEALDLINEYAPEHFIVCSEKEAFFCNGIQNAGSVFIGNYSPESAGDYASGTNHTLPTNGFAKNYEGVNLDSFLKSMTFQKITKEGIQSIGRAVEIMAEAEGLQAHKNAVTLRLEEIKKQSS